MLSPVSCASCSRMCLVGFGVAANADFSVSSCLALIVVLGPRRFAPAAPAPLPAAACPLPSTVPPTSSPLSLSRFSPTLLLFVRCVLPPPALGRDPLVSSPQLDIESTLQSSVHGSRSLPMTSLPLAVVPTTPRGPQSGGVTTSIFSAPACGQSLLNGDVQAPRTPPPPQWFPAGRGNTGDRCDGESSAKHWSGAVVDGLLTSRSDSPSSSLSCCVLSTSASVASA